ncbi:MAG: RidA family protein [Rhizobiales bacterium]|jgi:enamine deaminase RidA (YjgF/YER057c/UK114 family)|nr:RidA family protein [Hyphomicrobiales bacterium]
MANEIEQRLQKLGVQLPSPAAPVANYVGAVVAGNLLVVSGQLPIGPNGITVKGKLGAGVSEAEGKEAARLCAINILAQAKAALGDLTRIKRCIRLGGFVNAVPDYQTIPQVVNGASDFMVEALGDAGKHARYAIGVAQLPLDAPVEVEAMFEIS